MRLAVTKEGDNTDQQAPLALAEGSLPAEDLLPPDPRESLTAEEELEENEPYLGPAWAVVMLVLYLLKEAFPAEQFSPLWWFQLYIIVLVIAITVFTMIKRHQFYRAERQRRERTRQETTSAARKAIASSGSD